MRTAVHPDRRLLFLHVDVAAVRDEPLGGFVHVWPEAYWREWSFERIVPGMRAADPLRRIEVRRRPTVGSPPTFGAEGHSSCITGHAAAVLISRQGAPVSSDVHLGE